jgi:anti-sigma B factor antagonist
VLLRLAGRITIDSSPSLRDQLLVVLNEVAIEQITIDLKSVSFIDLSGIATFIEALKTARAGKTRLLLTGLQDQPCYLLEVSGLLSFFQGAGDTQPDGTLKGQR